MGKRLDHEKASKAARSRAGEGIAREDRTLSAHGYPPAGGPKAKLGEGYHPAMTVSPVQVKTDTVEQVRHAHVLNEIEKARLKAELCKKKAALAAERKTRAASNAAGRISPSPTKSVLAPGKIQQQFAKGRMHEVTVEIRSPPRRASKPPTTSQ